MKSLFKSALVAVAMLASVTAFGQELTVREPLQLAKGDRTACAKATARKDANGKKLAVVKVNVNHIPERDAAVTAGSASVDPQIVIYAPAGTQSLEIAGADLGSIVVDLAEPLKAGKTYTLGLTCDATIPDQQFVLFTVMAAEDSSIVNSAVVEIAKETLVVDENGEASKLLTFCEQADYTYKVSAKGFYSTEASFTITKAEKACIDVLLKEGRSTLNVDVASDEFAGADVFVDGERVGTAPGTFGHLTAGRHTVLISKADYENQSAAYEFEDDQVVTVLADLSAAFAPVVVKTVSSTTANIWANGENIGVAEFVGPLRAGTYVFESREVGYVSSKVTTIIHAQKDTVVVTVPDPLPIYGKIIVTSKPAKADVVVNGEKVETTPVIIPTVQYGEYTIEVSKEGYETYTETVVIDESKKVEINAELVPAATEAPCECCHPVPADTVVVTEYVEKIVETVDTVTVTEVVRDTVTVEQLDTVYVKYVCVPADVIPCQGHHDGCCGNCEEQPKQEEGCCGQCEAKPEEPEQECCGKCEEHKEEGCCGQCEQKDEEPAAEPETSEPEQPAEEPATEPEQTEATEQTCDKCCCEACEDCENCDCE